MPSYADVISTVALTVATLSAFWQVGNARLNRPQIRIQYEWIADGRGTTVTVKVLNYGGQPVDVNDVGILYREKTPRSRSQSFSSFRDQVPTVAGRRLPTRLDPGGQAEWSIPGWLLAAWLGMAEAPSETDTMHGPDIAGYAEFVAAPTIFRPNALRKVRMKWFKPLLFAEDLRPPIIGDDWENVDPARR